LRGRVVDYMQVSEMLQVRDYERAHNGAASLPSDMSTLRRMGLIMGVAKGDGAHGAGVGAYAGEVGV
jgi:hypothetical protein